MSTAAQISSHLHCGASKSLTSIWPAHFTRTHGLCDQKAPLWPSQRTARSIESDCISLQHQGFCPGTPQQTEIPSQQHSGFPNTSSLAVAFLWTVRSAAMSATSQQSLHGEREPRTSAHWESLYHRTLWLQATFVNWAFFAFQTDLRWSQIYWEDRYWKRNVFKSVHTPKWSLSKGLNANIEYKSSTTTSSFTHLSS